MPEPTFRRAARVVDGVATSDGDGVNLTRIIGTRALRELDPFLLLDVFKSDNPDDYIGGFPSHPHRGFETITYLLHGEFTHRDSRGNEGHLTAGSVQWMTAGRGIIHSEMPAMTDGLVWGYQLWLNLPAEHKMTDPRYQDIPPEDIPVVAADGVSVKVIAGEYGGAHGPARTWIPAQYLDITLAPGATFTQPVPEELTCFAYVIEGEARVGPADSPEPGAPLQLLVLEDGDAVQLEAGEAGARFLLLAARRLDEPIARQGPFVMNTMEEVYQAFADYQAGTFDKWGS